MCLTASRLRQELYCAAVQVRGEYPMSDGTREIIELNRQSPEYIMALKALKEHLKECEECKTCVKDLG
jgi:hypothetical protein